MRPLPELIDDAYTSHAPDDHILPWYGGAFTDPGPRRLRVMAVGINSYVSADELKTLHTEPLQQKPWGHARFREWCRGQHFRFFRRSLASCRRLAEPLCAASELLKGLEWDGLDSLYATNAIKRYVPAHEGRYAHQITPAMLHRDQPLWDRELELLAERGAFPHLIVIFGEAFWGSACQTFKAPANGNRSFTTSHYLWTDGPCLHFVNRLAICLPDGTEQVTLLIRCAHPAARTDRGRPGWLLAQPDFRCLAGLPRL